MAPSTTAWTSQRPKGFQAIDKITSQGGQALIKSGGNSNQQAKKQSYEVKRLNKLISSLQDPKSVANEVDEGCFCLAQAHSISLYVPNCASCGLLLCELNQPYRNCPFKQCNQPLFSPQARTALIDSLSEKVAQTLAEEEENRRREAEEQRKAAGAFPQLGPGHSTQSAGKPSASPAPAHKVLSLTSKGAVLTTVRKATPALASRPVKEDTTPVIQRIRPPPPEPAHFTNGKDIAPWESHRAERLVYIPPVKATQERTSRKKRPKKEQET